jgi:hypothetical protein
MDFVDQEDVTRLQHHQQTLHLTDGADVLGQFDVAFGYAEFTGHEFGQSCLAGSTRAYDKKVWERTFFAGLGSFVPVGVECSSQDPHGSLLPDDLIQSRDDRFSFAHGCLRVFVGILMPL